MNDLHYPRPPRYRESIVWGLTALTSASLSLVLGYLLIKYCL